MSLEEKHDEILRLVDEYIREKHSLKKWTPGEDWVQYSGPFFDSREFVAATRSLLSEWLVLGEDAIKFEKSFPKLFGKDFGIVTNSGSSSNLIMMQTAKKYFNLKIRTPVITPVAGFPTTVNPILQSGFDPVFIDIELDTLNIDLQQVEEAVQKGAHVITFAHVLGNPPNMDKLKELIEKHHLIVLEDCCDALGTTYRGVNLGNYGIMSSCSFYPAHHITMGEGGFVACENKELEQIARSFREWGRGCYCVGKKANLSIKGSCGCRFKNWLPSLPNEIFDHKYVYENIGYNLKPIELQCSIGLEQLKKLPEITQRRKENYRSLFNIFKRYDEHFILPKAREHADVSWFAFPLTIKDNAPFKRSDFCKFLESNKIQTRNYFGGNLLLQPAYYNVPWWEHNLKRMRFGNHNHIGKESFPNATKVTTDTFFLGTSPIISNLQTTYIQEIVDRFFKNVI